MYRKIMIPVDLRHCERLDKALKVAADLGRLYHAELHIVSVGPSQPSEVARSPEEFSKRLAHFSETASQAHGATYKPHAETSHDPAVELDAILAGAAERLDIDLIVMASHIPGLAEHVFSSNAGYLASHATISVLIVR
ncbi:Universal stress protein UP12 (plasmid) [Sulfitobacter sp. DSM 110093]|uniref:universal stress protein n=1 Tax=Sulfitobacter sp. DSM 110093 TaxID=2883127 RepID=UPI001FAE2CE1|nr:universal stress protein [Sulfitobacter sp. DSM 110093]UOA33634.1 Universal stress protein UP12 [Sulfitobacter sp. DSM 110093]